jgi:hypothetical protein
MAYIIPPHPTNGWTGLPIGWKDKDWLKLMKPPKIDLFEFFWLLGRASKLAIVELRIYS